MNIKRVIKLETVNQIEPSFAAINSPLPLQTAEVQFGPALKAAVADCLLHIQRAISENRYVSSVFDWYALSVHPNGMPAFTKMTHGGPKDYTSVLSGYWDGQSQVPDPTEQSSAIANFEALVFDNQFLLARMLPVGTIAPIARDNYLRDTVRHVPKKVANSYVQRFGTTEFMDHNFDELLTPIKNGLFSQQLSIDIWVPILFLEFSFDDLRIGDNAKITRMTSDDHTSRSGIRSFGSGAHEAVIPCATHAFVAENWTLENRNHWDLIQAFNSPSFFPVELINKFFGGLRIVTGYDTGYSQLLAKPHNWETCWTSANRYPMFGNSTRSYPSFFENFHWLTPKLPSLDIDRSSACGTTFRRLIEAKENSIGIAIRRLNRCYCRDDDEDLVIDATIALEALISDGQPQEMTHKLAMRVAMLSQLVPGQTRTAQQVFDDIKQIYKYRSKIVHGSAPKEQDRKMRLSGKDEVATSAIAREHLRSVLRVLIDHQQLRSAKNLDEHLLSRITASYSARPPTIASETENS